MARLVQLITPGCPLPQTGHPMAGGSRERGAHLGSSAQGDEGERVLRIPEGGEQHELLPGGARPRHVGGRHGLSHAASMICTAPAT